jgi:hypothetical protein
LADFEAARPAILGALLNAVAHGVWMLPESRLDRLPRMADFALWITACEGGLGWQVGTFMAAYEGNQRAAIDDVVDDDPMATAVRDLMGDPARQRDLSGRAARKGTAKSLFATVRAQVGDAGATAKTWQALPRALGGRLRRVAAFPHASGIEITIGVSIAREHRSTPHVFPGRRIMTPTAREGWCIPWATRPSGDPSFPPLCVCAPRRSRKTHRSSRR